jgi:hypothetical protein
MMRVLPMPTVSYWLFSRGMTKLVGVLAQAVNKANVLRVARVRKVIFIESVELSGMSDSA